MNRPPAVDGGRTRSTGPFSGDWERLAAEIRACRLCPLGATRTHAVVYRGGPSPRVVFVGEAPGATEDATGRPFMGRSGARLDAAVAAVGLADGEFGVLNVLKCRPPENRFDRLAARTCRPYLRRQLELLHPRALVPLGAVALRELAPEAPPVLTAAGRPYDSPDGPIFPLIHPAAALRSRTLRERWDRDVRALGAWLRSAV